MKKGFIFPLLLAGIALPSCGGAPATSSIVSSQASSSDSIASSDPSASSSIPTEEVNKLKSLLAKQDLSPAYDKMFVTEFRQNYEHYTSNNGGEEEADTSFYTYRGSGVFGCLYEVSEAAYEEAEALEDPNFFDYLSRGKGSYAMIQNGALVSYQHEIDGEDDTESLQCLDFLQNMETRFTEDKVQVVNSLYTKDTLDGGYDGDARQYFNGKINKETLFDTITVRAFSDIFARTNLFDGQRSCERIDRIYFDVARELRAKTDAELGEFIVRNDIRFEEKEESILVHFKVGDESLRATLEENDIIPGVFEGTLTYEKESGKFDAFEYGIRFASNETDAEGGKVYITSMEFEATGYSWNQKYGSDPYIDPDAALYDDAEAFLEDVVEEVIPPVF